MALDPENLFFTADNHFGHEALYSRKVLSGGREYHSRSEGIAAKGGMKSRAQFKDAAECDARQISEWNAVVPPGGVVCHVGDFTFGRASKHHGNEADLDYWKEIVSQLNGTIIYILGNHDDRVPVRDLLTIPKIVWAGVRRRISVNDPEGNVQRKHQPSYQEIVLDHFPLRVWDKKRYGAWHLYGHMHGSSQPYDLSFDVGVDTNNFRPYTYAQVKEKMKSFDAKQRVENRA